MTRKSHALIPLALLVAAPAQAQDTTETVDIEVPTVVLDRAASDQGPVSDTEIDLANIVQSAAKGVTTVQEAPAIVTVVTQDEIKDRQLQSFEQIIDTVPGWIRLGAVHGQFPFPLARGQMQAAQLLHDGVSMFDPYVNNTMFNRIQAVELIKRVEFITGPGGVLWGSNSMMGIVNVITKDAEDVDGVEVGGQIGDGNGDRQMARAYAMVGAPDLFGGKLKFFAHGSVESYKGPGFEMPQHLFSASIPQPNSPNIYGPLTQADPPRSLLTNFHAKLTLGKLQLRVHVPWADRYTPVGFPGSVQRENLPEDDLVNMDTGMPACVDAPPYGLPGDDCVDNGKAARQNSVNFLDRYGVLEYRTRFAGGRAGASAKAYLVEFQREFPQLTILAPSTLLEGGLTFDIDFTTYRAGFVYDGDVELPRDARLLYGVEAFHEWLSDNTSRSRQGAGREATFGSPYNLARLPLPCPRDLDENGNVFTIPGCPLTAGFQSSRTILGAYINPQWRPSRRLMLDAGARLQLSPEALGDIGYDLTQTFGASVVYNFIPNWYVKLNGTQGFRPPVFAGLVGNSEAISIGADPTLEVETSTAGQVEVNARIFKGERRLRELGFRADYSYTYLHNLIQILTGGRYTNTADRGIHSVEFLGKLYVQGGHRLELGYTWLYVITEDTGLGRSTPEHWFNLAAVFNLIDERLEATSTLRVLGATEDPNRMVEHRGVEYDERGRIVDVESGMPTFVNVAAHELTLDRLPPVADLMLALQFRPTENLRLHAVALNVFNARYYQVDGFSSYEPRLERLPNPSEDFRAYIGATYNY